MNDKQNLLRNLTWQMNNTDIVHLTSDYSFRCTRREIRIASYLPPWITIHSAYWLTSWYARKFLNMCTVYYKYKFKANKTSSVLATLSATCRVKHLDDIDWVLPVPLPLYDINSKDKPISKSCRMLTWPADQIPLHFPSIRTRKNRLPVFFGNHYKVETYRWIHWIQAQIHL